MLSSKGKTTGSGTTDLLQQVAHDMGSPLTVLNLFFQLAERRLRSDPQLARLYATALHACERLRALRDQLHRPGQGLTAARAPVDVALLVRNQLESSRVACEQRDIGLYYTGPCHCIALLDKALVDRVLQNLVTNAIQAMGHGRPHVWVHCFATNDGLLGLDVIDNGVGIPPSNLERIFDDGFTFGKLGGTGIGLAFCQAAIEAHDGTLAVGSAVGQGTCFQIRIPDAVIAVAEDAAEHDAALALAVRFTDTSAGRWWEAFQTWCNTHGNHHVAIFDAVAPVWHHDGPEID